MFFPGSCLTGSTSFIGPPGTPKAAVWQIGTLDSPEGRRLIDDGTAAVYAPTGFLLFAPQGKSSP